jgi:hypothetical protein
VLRPKGESAIPHDWRKIPITLICLHRDFLMLMRVYSLAMGNRRHFIAVYVSAAVSHETRQGWSVRRVRTVLSSFSSV